MFPPSAGYTLDIEAISGIMGSISIACWVVVFSPQIIENFRRSSAEGLSIEFVIIWLAGDFANIIGAVMQGVLPTMIILAIYYTFADILLLGQCFYYRGFHFRDPKPLKPSDTDNGTPNENSALLPANGNGNAEMPRTRSGSSFGERFVTEGVHMSPANPMHPVPKVQRPRTSKRSLLQKVLFNMTVITLVVAAGIAGYYLSPSSSSSSSNKTEQEHQNDNLHFNLTGQIFGYLCALLYLGSRIPQLLLNYRRKSTEGLNALFFLFACIGNLTYVLSIFAFNPLCHHRHHGKNKCRPGEAQQIYGRYILVNLSWILGSLGTLFLDFGVFAQFFIYRSVDDEVEEQQQQQQEEEQAVQDVFEDRGRSVQ